MLATVELMGESAQRHLMKTVVPRWLSEVPLYERGGRELYSNGQADGWERLPFITKQDIRRDFPRNFLRPGVELEALLEQDIIEVEHTSGTSEERIPLLLGRGWWVEQEERALRLNPFVARVLDEFPEARRVTISSPVCNGDVCYTGTPTRSDRIVGRSLYVSLARHPFLWTEDDLARMVAEAVAWQPQFLDVDPVYGMLFARYCERNHVRLPSLCFILCSYEFVSVHHRRILERVFGVPVFNLYGSTETGHLLMETERGEMVPSLGTAFLEVIEPDTHKVGELVVTTLTNDFMPLIRYRIGDLVERHRQPDQTTYTVHGRAADSFQRPDGGRITTQQVEECFAGLGGVAHYQLVEHYDERWMLRYLTDVVTPSAVELGELKRRLIAKLGITGGITLLESDVIMPEKSGKFRLGYPARWKRQDVPA